MNITLSKDGVTINQSTGMVLYTLFQFIPGIGGLIYLILTILKRQFKGLYLNRVVIDLVIVLTYFLVLIMISFVAALSIELALLLVMVASILVIVASVYIFIYYIRFGNILTIKARLNQGYVVENPEDPGIQDVITQAQNFELPKFQFIKF